MTSNVFAGYDLVVLNYIKNLSYCTNSSACTTIMAQVLTIYQGSVRNLLSQSFFGLVLGVYFVAMGSIMVVWDWLPISFRLLFMGKPSDYDWDKPYTY